MLQNKQQKWTNPNHIYIGKFGVKMWKERGIEYEGYIWRSEIFDCVTWSSNLEFKRAPAFGSFVFYVLLSLFFLFFPFCVSLWRKWASFFSLSISFLLFFWFFKFLSFTKTPQWKRWFLLYSSFISNPPLISLSTPSFSVERENDNVQTK